MVIEQRKICQVIAAIMLILLLRAVDIAGDVISRHTRFCYTVGRHCYAAVIGLLLIL